MLYPITMLLWAFLSVSLISETPNHPQLQTLNSQSPTYIYGDSLIFNELKTKLESRQKETAPEKLYLHLDRALYQPGETAWFSAYVRNAGDLLPSAQSQVLYVELLDSRGSVIQQKTFLALDGIAAGEFDFSKDLPGGLYKIKAYTRWMQNTSEAFERTLTLQKVVLPNLNLKLEFERKAFGPGNIAIARFDAYSLDNKALANQKINFTAAVSGQNFTSGEAQTDANGRAYVRFQLPEKIEKSDGLLNIQIEHNGQTEAISRAIPIVLNKIDLQFFPEGGDAVAGLPARVAFKAVNEFGKPADVEGAIFDSKGKQVATFGSYHNGMGAFDFVPQRGERYEARITKPFSSGKASPLPEVQSLGYALRLQAHDADNLTLEVSTTTSGKVYLAGQSQDKLFFFKELNHVLSEKIVVPIKDLPVGIVRFTLFDKNKNEQAERLAFVNRDKGLKIELKPDKEQYLPREKVNLKIHVSDHAGRPVQGKFSLAVSDEKLLNFADDKQGHLLASLLLEQDLKGSIEEPNFYFDPAEPKSEQALDYLLMTQGWRRFVWKEVLDSQPIANNFEPERAVVEGKLFKRDEHPADGEKVTLYPNGPSQQTDKEGHFSFKNVDLDKYSHLHLGGDVYHRLYEYGIDYNLLKNGQKAQKPAKIYRHHNRRETTILRGKVIGDDEPLVGATVLLKGTKFGTRTDVNGEYKLTVPPGTFDIVISYTGYSTYRTNKTKLVAGKNNFVDVTLDQNMVLQEMVVTAFGTSRQIDDEVVTLTSDQIRNLPTRSVNAITAASAGEKDDEPKVKGSRGDGKAYFVDGIRVNGAQLPAQEIEKEELDLGGTLADQSAINEVMVIGFAAERDKDPLMNAAARSSLKMEEKQANEFSKKSKPAPYWHYRNRQFSRAREFYAPKYDSQQQPAQRSDFRSTIYWNPNIQTDKNGKVEVEFYTSDAITNFRATLEGIDNQGQAGRGEQKFFVQKPLSLAVKIPASVISGDELKLQIAISNKTNYPMGGHLSLTVPEHFSAKNKFSENVHLAAGKTKIIPVEYLVGLQKTGNQSISIKFSADENVLDAFETTIRTLDRGYPVRQIASGNAAQNAFNIQLNEPVEGTLSATLTAYPSALEDVLKGMERMLSQPSGCFEQVSSSNYPNLLVLDLLRETGAAQPEVESRAMTLLEDGYKKLTAYECKSGGFDWWGRDPAHEGLTAYGLLEFSDMAKVFSVDKSLINRTVKWLESRRDGKGSWQINPNSLHGWQKDGVLDAYIAWAVAEAGYGKKFADEINQAHSQAVKSGDPYEMALLANALLATKDERGNTLVKQLLEKQEDNGSWLGSSHSVMHAYGDCFRIETTALGALALMKSGDKSAVLQKALNFIIQSKNEYGYGSTQSTVMALKALVEYAKIGSQSAAEGTLVVQVDGRRVAEQAFSTRDAKRLEIKNLEQFFTSDNPRLEVFFENSKAVIPFDLEIKYASRQPRNSANCPLAFKTELGKTTAEVGETVRLTATLQNTVNQAQASPMVVLGIPAGLTLQPWQLKKFVDEKQCDFYELWDGFAVFHFEKLGANETRTLNLDLRADVAGAFETPASQAFLYYSNDQRVWSKPEKLTVNN